MKLKTSYFNSTAFRKDITRFAPAWALYTVFLMLMILTMRDFNRDGLELARSLHESLPFMVLVNLGYGLLCGQLLFGDLFQARSCNALHALPLRREGWFLIHTLSGLAFSLIPTTAAALFASLLLEDWWYVAFVWLLEVFLQYLFFFGVAAFSAYSVGSRFAMVMVYGLVNFVSILAYWLTVTFYEPALYGIRISSTPFCMLSPVVYLFTDSLIKPIGYRASGSFLFPELGYLAACALAGLVFLGIALCFYRRRKLECAGDFITVRQLSPVFLVLYTLCAGAALYLFHQLFIGGENLVLLFLGFAIGFFTGRMLLERTLRVFRPKAFLGLGVLSAVFILSLILVRLDPVGITRWVPEADDVVKVRVSPYTHTIRTDNPDLFSTEDPTVIQTVLDIHRHGIENPQEATNGKRDSAFAVEYTLKNGSTAQRYYDIDLDTDAGRKLRFLFSDPDYVLGDAAKDAEAFSHALIEFLSYYDGEQIPTEGEEESLYQAILQDCLDGHMAQYWDLHENRDAAVAYLILRIDSQGTGGDLVKEITLYSDCENTIAWLRERGYLKQSDPKMGG